MTKNVKTIYALRIILSLFSLVSLLLFALLQAKNTDFSDNIASFLTSHNNYFNKFDKFALHDLDFPDATQAIAPSLLSFQQFETPLAERTYDENPPQAEQTDLPSPPTQPSIDDEQTPSESTSNTEGLPIRAIDMSEGQTADNTTYKNQSKYTPDINSLAKCELPIKLATPVFSSSTAEPVVLIIHTHGTECYTDSGSDFYNEQTPTRTTDIEKNVVAVGKALADTLNESGIPTLHCTTMFDEVSYSESYDNSEKAVLEYLKKYPSIQYIFDVHRDSIVQSDGTKLKPIANIDGQNAAQIMIVVGTDSMGANHPDWQKNLTVASIFQSRLIAQYPSLMRPINLRAASFNAEHTIGSLLLEFGSCGNTLEEAQNAARYFGKCIAEVILQ